MLAHIQMARLTCAALLERCGRPVTSVDWQHLILGSNKAGRNKRWKLPEGIVKNFCRNHHNTENRNT